MSKEKMSQDNIKSMLGRYLKSNKKIENEIGNFTIKRQVGQGGTSVIWEVGKEGDKKEYVIKFLLENELDETRAYKRFKQAFNAISKLKSDAILPQIYLYSLKISEKISIPYVLMPKAKGGTLKNFKEKKEITFEIFEFIFNRMIYLLKEIHNEKIIHRDLKPENIFLLEKNNIESMVLGDFDIAKFDEKLYEKLLKTKNGERLANYLFSAPEQKEKAKKFEIKPSADLYAFGQILYWLIMGETLQGQNKIKFSRYDKRFEKYELIVERLLQDDSDDRFQSVEEIEKVLLSDFKDEEMDKRDNGIKEEVIEKIYDFFKSNPYILLVIIFLLILPIILVVGGKGEVTNIIGDNNKYKSPTITNNYLAPEVQNNSVIINENKEKGFYIKIKDNDNGSFITKAQFYKDKNCTDDNKYISLYDSQKKYYYIKSVKIDKGFESLFMGHYNYGCLELKVQTDDTSPIFNCTIDCTKNINKQECGEDFFGRKTAICEKEE